MITYIEYSFYENIYGNFTTIDYSNLSKKLEQKYSVLWLLLLSRTRNGVSFESTL